MKKTTTLFILLFAFLKLSASVNHIDTLSLSAVGNISSYTGIPVIVLHPEKLPVPLNYNNADSVKLPIPLPHRDSLRSSNIALQPAKNPSQNLNGLKQKIMLFGLDSLKALVKLTADDTLKALLYTEIANRYLANDTITDKGMKFDYKSEALGYTMKALHLYSSYNDTTGLRMNFDNLAKIYFSEKKYVQAKWFILQSNSLSRAKKDVPNIITSLLTLAAIKSEIKDYKLAMRDLDEALRLCSANHYPRIELDVLKRYALLYSRLHDYPKEALMLKKRDSLEENIHRKEQAVLLAKVALQDSIQKKRLDSVQNKKKAYISNMRKPYKGNSPAKTVSL